MNQENAKSLMGYEYKDITVLESYASQFVECYRNFGWDEDKKIASSKTLGFATIRLKRNRKIINKMELTRLERHFEACATEIQIMEHSKANVATAGSLLLGLIGASFITGAVLSAIQDPPIVPACVVDGILGLLGMALPCTVYNRILKWRSEKMNPIIESKHDEVYDICKKGFELL